MSTLDARTIYDLAKIYVEKNLAPGAPPEKLLELYIKAVDTLKKGSL